MKIIKLLLTFPYFWRMLTKAKSMTKKLFEDPEIVNEEYRYNWVKKRAKYILWLHNVKVVAHGYKNWLPHGCLIVSNHQSNLDPIIFIHLNDFSINSPVAFIAKKELLKDKKMIKFLYLIDVLFLDRKNPRQSLEVLKNASDLIRVPRSLVLFPEGTRSQSATIGEFKSGLLSIAQKSHRPIIPVTIINSYKFDKKKAKKLYIHVFFNKPIKPINLINKSREIVSNNIKSTLQEQISKNQNISLRASQIAYKHFKALCKKIKKGKSEK